MQIQLDVVSPRVVRGRLDREGVDVAADHLGGAELGGGDGDPLAIEAATDNARRNDVELDLHSGSLEAVPAGTFEVVVANLDTTTLSALAADITARLEPRGLLVASGVSIERRAEAEAAFADAGLTVLTRPGREWVVLTGIRT